MFPNHDFWCIAVPGICKVQYTVKIPKFRTLETNAVIILKWNSMILLQSNGYKNAHGMANSVDPEAQSDLGLYCLPRPVCPKT